MDALDRKILDILKRNSRTPYLKIAEQTGLSEGAVRKRVRALIRNGTIRRFTILTGPVKKIRAIVLISSAPGAPLSRVSNSILNIEGVTDGYEVSGEYDVLSMVEGDAVDEINRTVDKIRAVEGVAKTVTSIVLR
ncbi:MAG: Lrp/AsnC family transcriptional regulator [Aigarchaeota archaeon]|nr:Lrp/AsnC family transcriptional regulator [Aigarchaeota archaeon]